jgi:hypothetical protein
VGEVPATEGTVDVRSTRNDDATAPPDAPRIASRNSGARDNA